MQSSPQHLPAVLSPTTVLAGTSSSRRLKAKAETDSVGVLVSSAAYGSEYAQLRGMMNELQKTAVDKNLQICAGCRKSRR